MVLLTSYMISVHIVGLLLCYFPFLLQDAARTGSSDYAVNEDILIGLRLLYGIGSALSVHKLVEQMFLHRQLKSNTNRSMKSNRYSFNFILITTTITTVTLFIISISNFESLWVSHVITSSNLLLIISISVGICRTENVFRSWQHSTFILLYSISEGLSGIGLSSYTDGTLIISSRICGLILSFISLLLYAYITSGFTSPPPSPSSNDATNNHKSLPIAGYWANLSTLVVRIVIPAYLVVKIILPLVSLVSDTRYRLAISLYIRYFFSMLIIYMISWIPLFEAIDAYKSVVETLHLRNSYITYTAHEIRSPISTVLLGLDLAKEELSTAAIDTTGVLEIVDQMKVSINTALETLNELLLFDKIQNSSLSVDLKPVLVWPFLVNVLDSFQLQARALSVNLSLSHDEQFDKNAITADIDASKLQIVMRNFLSNALKFSKHGSSVEVIVSTNDQENISDLDDDYRLLVVQVRDHGPGISKLDQSKLFNLFVQVNADRLQGGKGSGIGLWISKQIIELHQGLIGVESEGEGTGSTFYFKIDSHTCLPTAIDNPSTGATHVAIESATSNHQGIDLNDVNMQVLRVEDDAIYMPAAQQDLSSRNSEMGSSDSVALSLSSVYPSSDSSTNSQPGRDNNNHENNMRNSKGYRISTAKKKKHILALPTHPEDPGAENKMFFTPTMRTGTILSPDFSRHKYKILMVDDVPLVRKMVERALAEITMLFDHACDGIEVLDIIALKGMEYYDIILMDGYMPRLTGFEATRRLRGIGYKGLIFGVSGTANDEDNSLFKDCGVDKILSKPLNLLTLRQAILDHSVGGKKRSSDGGSSNFKSDAGSVAAASDGKSGSVGTME